MVQKTPVIDESKIIQNVGLHRASLDDLIASKIELEKIIQRDKKLFLEHKKKIILEFSRLFDKNKDKLVNLLEHSKEGFLAAIERAEDLILLSRYIDEEVASIAQIETTAKIYSVHSLGKQLEKLNDDLCTKGELPREFEKHVFPKLPKKDDLIVRFGSLVHSKKYKRMKLEQPHLDFIEIFALGLSLVSDEEQLTKKYDSSIQSARALRSTQSSNNVFSATDLLPEWLESERLDSQKKGYLNKPKLLGATIVENEALLRATHIQIELKTLSIDNQSKRIKEYNNTTFLLLEKRNCHVDVTFFIQEEKIKLQSIHADILKLVGDGTITDISQALQMYAAFWGELVVAINRKVLSTDDKYVKGQYKVLQLKIIEGRRSLESNGFLTTSFETDQKHIIIERFSKYIDSAYRGPFRRPGRIRAAQINTLRDAIESATDTRHVATLIQESLYEMRKDHQTRSTAFNIRLFRRTSRAVEHLEDLLTDLEKDKLIPVIKIEDGIVLRDLKQTLQDYFDSDIFKNNASRRRIAEQLLDEIRAIEVLERKGEIHPAYAKQLRWEAFDKAINDASLLHTHGEGIDRLYKRFITPTSKSRLVDHLEKLRIRLSSDSNPQLSAHYLKRQWPLIEDRLKRVIDNFEAEQTPEIDPTDKKNAVAHARDMLNHLKIAGDVDIANGILQLTIAPMQREDFYAPELGAALFAAHQQLQTIEGGLPPIPLTEYGKRNQDGITKNIKTFLKKKSAWLDFTRREKEQQQEKVKDEALDGILNRPTRTVLGMVST